jgi:dTDP-4-dehydrorhamnose reductase
VGAIAGLMHHGGCPHGTQLLDPAFPRLFASHARAVAERFPQLDAFTPIDALLATARRCALDGLWPPHHRSDASFVRVLLNLVQATRLAMQAIRSVTAYALLVQTEEIGYTQAPPRVQYQANFENLRRWLALDLLAGRVDARHPMWRALLRHGASPDELMSMVDAPCPPDVIGLNCHVTSERFLDDRLALYPRHLHGGNRRCRYVDMPAVHVHGAQLGGFEARSREASERYGRPLAFTDVRFAGSRDEQLRWLHQAWRAALALRAEGVEVLAVTAGAAFGSIENDELAPSEETARYHPGLWDTRGRPPRPTALAALVRALARGSAVEQPVLDGPGWWQRSLRLQHPPHGAMQALAMAGRPLLISGAGAALGQVFARVAHLRGLPYRVASRAEMDPRDARSVEAALRRWQPWAWVDAAGLPGGAEPSSNQASGSSDPGADAALLAQACARHGVRLLRFARDATPLPPLQDDGPQALVIHSAALFGLDVSDDFAVRALGALRRGVRFAAAQDESVSPTHAHDLLATALDLLIDGETGSWRLANRGRVSWADFAHMLADAAGLDGALIDAVPARPGAHSVGSPALAHDGSMFMPTLQDAVTRCLADQAQAAAPLPSRERDDSTHATRLAA